MKVLIADDENLICEWLDFCISQNPLCELVGIAHNGKEALELYLTHEPDLILTDIKMPVMDGLELLHAIRSKDSHAHVVILTAFADFEIARQALREGANEYFLKTEMQNETLQAMLERICREETARAQLPNDVGTAQAHAIVRKILRQEGELSETDLAELRRCGVHWRNNGLFAMAVWKKDLMHGGLLFPQDENMRHVAGFDYTDRIYIVIGNMARTLSESEKRRGLLQYSLQTQQANHCMVGVSCIADAMSHISALAQQATYALAQGFYKPELRIFEASKPLPALQEASKQWQLQAGEVRKLLHKQQNTERCASLIDFLGKTAQLQPCEIDLVTKFCTDALELILLDAKERSTLLPLFGELRARLSTCVTLQETTDTIEQVLQKVTEAEHTLKPTSKAVALAVDYLHANYAASISLEDVAEQVYLNADYFSRVFKEEMGISFVNYLTDLRLRHSVQLLETTALRVQDIAQRVGYQNVSYFSTIFKKKYNMSPFEYRRRN